MTTSLTFTDAFFPRFKDKLKDAILPILNDLNNETLRKKLIPIIKNKLNNLDKNNTNYLDFLEIFHSVETDKTLLYIRDLIEAESSETIPLSEVKFEINAIPYSENHPEALPRYINILPITTNDGALKISLELLLSYLDKKPKYTPKILDLFIRYFGIKYYSSSYHYKIQKQAIETIWKRCQNEQNDFFPKFYCCIAKEYLQANHSFGELSRGKTLTLGTFNIDVTKEFLTLRTIILEQLLKLYEQEICQKEILNIIYLQTQPSNGLKFHSNEIIELDSKILLP